MMQIAINSDRLVSDLQTLAAISEAEPPAVTRVVYSDTDRHARAWFTSICERAGLPVRAEGRDYTYGFLPKCTAPKLFISGDRDQYGPRDVLEGVFERAPEPKRLIWVAGADHFFQGTEDSPGPKLNLMQEEIRAWLRSEIGLS